MPVVYQALNTVNGHRYIGVTKDAVSRRRARHYSFARLGHTTMPFYFAIRKYGESAFVWSILEEFETYEDALAGEIRWIAQERPDYNVTRGGKGAVGTVMSEAAKAKLSALRKGVPRSPETIAKLKASQTPERLARFSAKRKGYKHRPDTVEKLRAAGVERKDTVFALYSMLGPIASSRPVICLDDGKKYESASAAARAYGVHNSLVQGVCQGRQYRRTAAGRRFVYADGSTPPIGDDRRAKLAADQIPIIRCVATYGISPKQIAWAYDVSPATIFDVIARRTWAHVE